MSVPVKTLLLLCLMGLSCSKKDRVTCADQSRLYACSKFEIGVAVDLTALQFDSLYREIVNTQFNRVTPENAFKIAALHPEKNQFNWTEADVLVDYCLKNNQKLHGHTLVWHANLPAWVENYTGSESDWEELFKNHIQTICRHFKGKVQSWDVVNEAFNENGTLRNSIWKQKLGPSYIEKAFQYAHEADPGALLFYNDFNLSMNPSKRKAVLKLMQNLRHRGVPIDGIGMQMHISIQWPENADMAEAMEEITEAGFKLHLSEIDISLNPYNKEFDLTEELLNRQADKMKAISLMYQRLPEQLQFGMSFWGVSDTYSWIRSSFNREDYPLLFDDAYQIKPMYKKLKETL